MLKSSKLGRLLVMVLSACMVLFAFSATALAADDPTPADNSVIKIYQDNTLKQTWSLTYIDQHIAKEGPGNYSTMNTWPTWSTYTNMPGARVWNLLLDAGIPINQLDANCVITFTSNNGGKPYSVNFLVGDLFNPNRYLYASETATVDIGNRVPIIWYDLNTCDSQLLFGQRFAQDQTQPGFLKQVSGVGAEAGEIHVSSTPTTDAWGGVTPDITSTIFVNQKITLTPIDGLKQFNNCKLYYTTNGSDPSDITNTNRVLYNPSAYKYWEQQPQNPVKPYFTTTGSQTLKIYIEGFGKIPTIQSLQYNVY